MINWCDRSVGHPKWVGGDRVEMTAPGRLAYLD